MNTVNVLLFVDLFENSNVTYLVAFSGKKGIYFMAMLYTY